MTPPDVSFSVLTHAYDPRPRLMRMTWHNFLDLLSTYEFRDEKLGGPLFSPCEFLDAPDSSGKYKSKENAKCLHFGVLDLDGVSQTGISSSEPAASHSVKGLTEPQFQAIYAKAASLDAFLYTTWSHPEAAVAGRIRARLLVPFSRPVSASEWPAVWPRLAHEFGTILSADGSEESLAFDGSCKDPSRFYFSPALPRGAEWAAQTWRPQGSRT